MPQGQDSGLSGAVAALLRALETACIQNNSSVIAQLTKFYRKATHICEELGPWAANCFIHDTVLAFHNATAADEDLSYAWNDGTEAELARILQTEDLLQPYRQQMLPEDRLLSDKARKLLYYLADQDPRDCSGIIFVQQRATVGVLCALLSRHSSISKLFQCGAFVGLSSVACRKYALSELVDLKTQRETLRDFRAGRRTLVIATDVLEEGIDIAACNLVVCFSPPATLKSYIQRRGRARKEQSRFIVMLPHDGDETKLNKWPKLEEALLRLYQEEDRSLDHIRDVENQEELTDCRLEEPSTGYQSSQCTMRAELILCKRTDYTRRCHGASASFLRGPAASTIR